VEVDPRWYEDFFDERYLAVAPNDPDRTTREVDFVVEQLGLEPGAEVLDLACGHGRHSVELARRGLRVTGLDASEPSLARAREAAAEAGVEVEWVHADMREVDERDRYDAVVNSFTAFGYFEEEADDTRVVGSVARALKPGGAFLIDLINQAALLGGFRPQSWQELEDGTLFLEDREYDLRHGRTLAHWLFIRPDGSRAELRHSLRVYAYHELARLLADAGLEVDGAWGGFDGAELTRDTWRLIVRARRPAAP
jgi:2-polyprenyl-3-methyl-5-hydroxy-6-metoxy-1,4-benzoquinol methylase